MVATRAAATAMEVEQGVVATRATAKVEDDEVMTAATKVATEKEVEGAAAKVKVEQAVWVASVTVGVVTETSMSHRVEATAIETEVVEEKQHSREESRGRAIRVPRAEQREVRRRYLSEGGAS